MTRIKGSENSKGYTLTELLIGINIITISSAAVFSLMSQVMVFSSLEENYHDLRNDVLLTVAHVRKDVQLSTNVVVTAGPHATGNRVLVLRQPSTDFAGEIQDGVFQYVTYSIMGGQGYTGGLLRQVWDSTTTMTPSESQVLNENIVSLGFIYGGKNISEIADLNKVRDIQIILISARETGLRLPEGSTNSTNAELELGILNDLVEYGLDFMDVHAYISQMNSELIDLAITASMGSVTMRNRLSLGL